MARLLGLRDLYAKLEFLNPTGSFKDRSSSVMMSVAREQGVSEIVEDSSGNAGASIAAYAARAGIRAHIFAPASAPSAKLQQIKVYGAEAHLIEGPREATANAALAYHREKHLVYASHALSPFFIEGTKTFAYEVALQFAERIPDHIVLPVGNGSLSLGTSKGFHELKQAALVSKTPRIHCVQASAFMPVVAAYSSTSWVPQDGARTVAGGISVAAPARLKQILDVLTETGGTAVAVDDEDILRWQSQLARREGIYGEPTSAAALAGLDRLIERGEIMPSDSVLVPITGFGLKDPLAQEAN